MVRYHRRDVELHIPLLPLKSLIQMGAGSFGWTAEVERDDGTAMVTGMCLTDCSVPESLMTQSLTGDRYIKSDEIATIEDLDAFDSGFLW